MVILLFFLLRIYYFNHILNRLNEGFASWVEILGLNSANPEFEALSIFVTSNSS